MIQHQVLTEGFVRIPTDQVWAVIRDAEQFAQWNPLFWFDGGLEDGQSTTLIVNVRGKFKARVPVTVDIDEAALEVRWTASKFGVRGSHWLRAFDMGNGMTQITHGEDFTGLDLIWRRVRDDIQAEYQSITDVLIAYLESNV